MRTGGVCSPAGAPSVQKESAIWIGNPLWNSLRIAAISSVVVFFSGIFCAYYAARLPRRSKGCWIVVLTLPMVLPPTVCGYFLLLIFGVKRPLGEFLAQFGIKFVMTWYGGILASVVVAFPLMYRTARGAFESFDMNLAIPARRWACPIPGFSGGSACRPAARVFLAGAVLAFARALGEYGATSMLIGYTPGKTATIPPPCTSSGAPTMRRVRSAGCW